MLVVLAWGQTVTRGFRTGRAWLPLLVLAGATEPRRAGLRRGARRRRLLGRWLEAVGLPVLQGLDPDRALVLLGVVLLQLSTGNVLVRLVLAATHTLNPAREGTPATRRPGSRAGGCSGRWSGC